MYEPAPDAAELAASGLKPEDFEGEVVEVWPENWPAFMLFHSLETQWDYAGMGVQRVGLKYLVLYAKMDRMGLDFDQYEELEYDIRTMEHAALSAMCKKSD